jgi:nucleoside-diphosphate-sugar epimerase
MIAITGANGYVGSLFVNGLRSRGFEVVTLGRSSVADVENREFSLGGEVSDDLFESVDLLIHCAYDFSLASYDEIKKINIEGSNFLIDKAISAGVKKIIFISSMSAFDGCRSLYGQAKLETEKHIKQYNPVILRPGLVYTPKAKGMVGSLTKLVQISPILPLIGWGDQPLFLASGNSLSMLVCDIAKDYDRYKGRTILAANPKAYSFKRILEFLASLQNKKLFLFPMPSILPWLGLKLLELVGLRIRMKSDGITSLINLEKSPDFSLHQELGISFEDFSEFQG